MQELKSGFDSFFRRISEAAGISSQNELACLLGVNRSAITQAKKRGVIPEKWILNLSRSFRLNPDWIETGQGPKYIRGSEDDSLEFTVIPKVRARLSAGGGSFEVGEEIEGYYSFRGQWLARKGSPRSMVLMNVFGNSMEPEIKDGDTILVDESQKDILAGAIYAVGVDDTVMVKRVEKHPNKLVLQSDNSTYQPIYLEGEEIEKARIIGKVLWVCRELR